MACEIQRVDHLDFNLATTHEIAPMLTDGDDTIFIFYAAQSASSPANTFRVYMRRYTASTATLSSAFQVSDDHAAPYNPRKPIAFRLDDGTLVCAWSGRETSSPVKVAESNDNGTTWTSPVTLSESANMIGVEGGSDGENVWIFGRGTGSPVSGQLHWFERIEQGQWYIHGRIFHITGETAANTVNNSWQMGHQIGGGAYRAGVVTGETTGFVAGGRYSGNAVSDEVKVFRTTNATRPNIGRPSSTLDNVAPTWLNQSGSSSNIHTSIDEAGFTQNDGPDADYIESQVGLSGVVTFPLTGQTDPGVNTGHSVNFRARRMVSGQTGNVTVTLRQGATAIESWLEAITNFNEFGDYTRSLSAANIANITDYNDLRLQFTPGGGAAQQIRISIAYLETSPASATWAEYMIEDRTGDASSAFNTKVLFNSGKHYAMYVLENDDLHLAWSNDVGGTWTVMGQPPVTNELNWDHNQHAFAVDAGDNLFESTVITTLPGITSFRLYSGEAEDLGSWIRIEDCLFDDPFDNTTNAQPADSLILGSDYYHLGGYIGEHSGGGLPEFHLMLIRIRDVAVPPGEEPPDEEPPPQPPVVPGDFNVSRIWRRGAIQAERADIPQPGNISASSIQMLDKVRRIP